ncbi:MAG: TRL domain-containing protein [Leptospirales bacterium]|jgi:hypothetical protein
MKKYSLLAVACAIAISIACVTADRPLDPPGLFVTPPQGSLFGSSKGNVNCGASDCTGVAIGTKTGEACASLVLGGFVAFGDMSVTTAAQNGGINKISIVDYSKFNVLGPIFIQKCTIVTGE